MEARLRIINATGPLWQKAGQDGAGGPDPGPPEPCGRQSHKVDLEIQDLERRAAQEDLEGRFSQPGDLAENAPVGLLHIDLQGLILQANPAACNLLRVGHPGLLRKPFPVLLAEDGREDFRALREALCAGDEPGARLATTRSGRAILMKASLLPDGRAAVLALLDPKDFRGPRPPAQP